MIEMRMDQRCALITGGSKGIGFAAAMNFVRAGANVAISSRRRPQVLELVQTSPAKGKERPSGLPATSATRQIAHASLRPPRRSSGRGCISEKIRIHMAKSVPSPRNWVRRAGRALRKKRWYQRHHPA